nr:hypothetical protein [uncultured Selenomonas sp.]
MSITTIFVHLLDLPGCIFSAHIEKRRFVRLLGLDFFDFRGKIFLYES